jgi:CubicO group peptidase (beta-lactamase class C family)
LLACATVTAVAAAGPSASPRLKRYLSAAAKRLDLNGTVLVAKDGKILVRWGYGFANAARRIRNRPTTRYRISSLTSDFTFVAIGQLERKGALRAEASVCAYVPRCPRAWRAVTVQLVVEARSGLALLPPAPGTRLLPGWIDWLRTRPLRFAPGRGRDRGDARLLLAAYLVERASGRSWIEYMRRNIFRPAGMVDTTFDRAGLARRATPYFRTRGRTLGPAAAFPPLVRPDVVYGLASTVDDMYRFQRALDNGTLLGSPPDEPSLELGHGPHGTADGWYTAFTHYPADRLTILVFNNMGGFSLGDVVDRVFLIAIGWPPPRVQVDAALLDRYAGRYTWYDGYRKRRVTVTLSRGPQGTLSFSSDRFAGTVVGRVRRGAWRMTLVPMDDATFFSRQLGWVVTFEVGAARGDDSFVLAHREYGHPDRYRRAAR